MLILRQSTQIRNLYCYQNNSFSGNKYNGYRRIFAFKTDKGRDNQIAHPIYLPPLSTSPESVKTVGGNQDVTLTIPGLAGFAMKVKANSVTFPDGSRVGTLVVSPVTADKRATVSEDGSVLITDSGSGITKAGWGGLCRYDPDKCATVSCKFCEKKNDASDSPCCVFDDSKDQLFHYADNIALSTEPLKNALDNIFKVARAFGELTIKLEGAVVGRREFVCCSIKQKESAKLKLSGQIKLEAQGKINLFQILDKALKFLPRDLKDATDAGLYLLIRGGGNLSGALSYDACKSERGSDSVSGSLYLNAATSARIAWPSAGIIPSAELNLGEVGITGGAKLLSLEMKSEGMASGNTEGFLYSYIKGDMRVGTLKVTSYDFQFPLIESAPNTISIPISDF